MDIYEELAGDSTQINQNSLDWGIVRMGNVTGSRFQDVITKQELHKIYSLTGKEPERISKGGQLIIDFLKTKPEAMEPEIIEACKLGSASSIATLEKAEVVARREVSQNYKLTKGANSYLNHILAEMVAGQPINDVKSHVIDWGNKYEDQARREYRAYLQKINNDPMFDVIETGFHTIEGHKIGCSPDGINSDGKGIPEFKCPFSEAVHMGYFRKDIKDLFGIPAEYFAQCIGNAWVLKKVYCDFVSFNPRVKGKFRLIVRRVYLRDIPAYVQNLQRCVFSFERILKQEVERLQIT